MILQNLRPVYHDWPALIDGEGDLVLTKRTSHCIKLNNPLQDIIIANWNFCGVTGYRFRATWKAIKFIWSA